MHKKHLPFFSETIPTRDILTLHPLVLASIGDSVQTLYTRTKYSLNGIQKPTRLHSLTSKEIKAVSQAKAMMKILPLLTQTEQNVYKRARNTKVNTIAKGATCMEYHIASGFESLIGFLYLSRQNDRLAQLLTVAYSDNKEKTYDN